MLSTTPPGKFALRWAQAAVAGVGVRGIPAASQIGTQPGAASLTDGFPPLNFTPVAAGGVPPFGQDMNGVLQQITDNLRWTAAGAPLHFDAAYATAIGGYPLQAMILSDSSHAWYENLVESNSTNPNAGGANWRVVSSVWSGGVWVAGGSANSQLLTFNPAPISFAQLNGIPFMFRSVGTNTGAVTLNINATGAAGLVAPNGTLLSSGALTAGSLYQAVFDNPNNVYRLLTHTSVFSDPGTGGLTIAGFSATGANLVLLGNGGTTPNKFIRAAAGVLQFMNSAYTTVLATLTDLGGLTTSGPITAVGNVFASSGRLRATLGAAGSGDPNAATLLSDYVTGSNANGWYHIMPDGVIIQGGTFTISSNNTQVVVNLPLAFPNAGFGVVASYTVNLSFGVPANGAIGIQFNPAAVKSQVLVCNNSTPIQPNGFFYIAVGN